VPWTNDGIDDIARLADQGRLPEAARLCEAHLRVHGPSAKAFHLMALICDADGDARAAVQYFRKVLYLDPNHHEALVHLSFLLEKQGDAGGAKTLRSRLQRLAPKGVS
jgi:chemotaxis protein methyltransferase WspC